MPSPRFVVSVADLDNGPKEISFTLPETWLRDVLEPAGASPRGPGSLTLEVTKQQSDVMVRGHADFGATLPCVVTLDPVDFDLHPEIFLMLRPGKAASGKATPARSGGPGAPEKKAAPAPKAEPKAFKRKKRPGGKDLEPEPSEGEAAFETFEGDEIVLDDFVREFLILELPLYPRRPDLPSPEESIVSRPLAGKTGEKSIDPRLEPLAKLAEQLRSRGNKE